MKTFHSVVAFLLLVSVVCAQNPMSVRFRFWKPIDRPAAKDEEIVTFTLDSDIYAATRAGMPDVRVLDEGQVETPFLIEPQVEYRQERSHQIFRTEIVKLRPRRAMRLKSICGCRTRRRTPRVSALRPPSRTTSGRCACPVPRMA